MGHDSFAGPVHHSWQLIVNCPEDARMPQLVKALKSLLPRNPIEKMSALPDENATGDWMETYLVGTSDTDAYWYYERRRWSI
jgi:hypothetical protein